MTADAAPAPAFPWPSALALLAVAGVTVYIAYSSDAGPAWIAASALGNLGWVLITAASLVVGMLLAQLEP